MKKTGLFLLAVVLVVGVAGCGGGGGGTDPTPARGAQLVGLYAYFESVTDHVCNWEPLGGKFAIDVTGDVVTVTWTGTRGHAISLSGDGNGFTGTWQNGAGGNTSFSGAMVSDGRLTGELYATGSGTCRIRTAWTAERIGQ